MTRQEQINLAACQYSASQGDGIFSWEVVAFEHGARWADRNMPPQDPPLSTDAGRSETADIPAIGHVSFPPPSVRTRALVRRWLGEHTAGDFNPDNPDTEAVISFLAACAEQHAAFLLKEQAHELIHALNEFITKLHNQTQQ